MKQYFIHKSLPAIIGLLLLVACTDDFEKTVPPVPAPFAQGTFTLRVPVKNGLDTRAMNPDQEYTIAELALLAFVDNDGTQELSFCQTIPGPDILTDDTDPRKYTIIAPLTPGTYSSIMLLANSATVLTDHSSLLVKGTPRATLQQALIHELDDGDRWNADTTTPTPIPLFGEVTVGPAGISVKPGEVPFTTITLKSKMPLMVIGGKYNGSPTTTWYRIDFVNRLNEETPNRRNEFIGLTRNYGYNIVIREVAGKGYATTEEAARCLPTNTLTDVLLFDDGDVENILFDGEYYLAVSLETLEFDKNRDTLQLKVKTDNPLGWKIEKQGDAPWLTIDRTQPSGPTDNGILEVTVSEHTDLAPRTAAFKISAGRLEYILPVQQSYLEGIFLEITDPDTGEPINEILFRSHPEGGFEAPNNNFVVQWKGPECKIHVGMLGNRKIELPNLLIQGGKLIAGQEKHTFTVPTPERFTLAEIDPQTGIPFLEEGAVVTFEVENGVESIKRTIHIRHQCINIVFDDLEELCYMGHEYLFKVRSNTSWRVSEVDTEIDNLFQTPGGEDYSTLLNTTGAYDTHAGTNFPMRLRVPDYNTAGQSYGIGIAGRKLRMTFIDEEDIFPPVTKTLIAILPDANCYRVLYGGGTLTPVGDGNEGRNGSIKIPLRKLFWIWEKELGRELNPLKSGGSPLNLTAELIWQSFDGLIDPDLELTDVAGQGDYRDFVLSLQSTADANLKYDPGNALVAIKNGNETLWSFHIWVTDYFPEDNSGTTFTNTAAAVTSPPVFMDYNLGATLSFVEFDPHQRNDSPDVSPHIQGLYYQHGRKDPFPGPRSDLTLGNTTIDPNNPGAVLVGFFNPGGATVLPTFLPVTELKNLDNSINNPTTYYYADSTANDWYTTGTTRAHQYDYFWVDKQERKEIYDPCPAGWRTAIYEPSDMEGTPDYHRFVDQKGSYVELPDGNTMFFPASGYIRRMTSGNLQMRNYRDTGYFVFGSPSQQDSGTVRGDEDGMRLNASISGRASATPVRCKRDDYKWYQANY
ncbi:MAG: BACON domain-containing protein [Bacteroides sp.]|nr:BACON domain-containing protein [Bacteroides sp.]